MRQRLSTMIAALLILGLVLSLGGCARSAEEREGAEATATSASGSSSEEGATPAPGETVVSAVTPLPQPTPVPVGTIDVGQPEPTTEPGGTTAQPTGAAPPGTGEAIIHVVQAGETLISIARDYGTSWAAIAEANNLVNADEISVGQELKIPTSEASSGGTSGGTTGCRIYHTVKRGEWVWQIARVYGVDPQSILRANGLTVQTADPIYPGTELCIP